MKLYLMLFHGRKSPEEELQDWGSDGPIFGPLEWVHTTYGHHIKLGYAPEFEFCDLHVHNDLLYYDGVWYGDWSASMFSDGEVNDARIASRIVDYEMEKSK